MTKESLYMGYENTCLAINSSYTQASDAAGSGDTIWKVLFEKVMNSDNSKKWFIPSIDELSEIYEYKDTLGISNWRWTWSSSEITNKSSYGVDTGKTNRNRATSPSSMLVCVDLMMTLNDVQ